jgi:hypothetical protein
LTHPTGCVSFLLIQFYPFSTLIANKFRTILGPFGANNRKLLNK